MAKKSKSATKTMDHPAHKSSCPTGECSAGGGMMNTTNIVMIVIGLLLLIGIIVSLVGHFVYDWFGLKGDNTTGEPEPKGRSLKKRGYI